MEQDAAEPQLGVGPAMTRILYWNLNNFSAPKVDVNQVWPANVLAQDRLTHIIDEVIRPLPQPLLPLPPNSPPPPDMIIIAEVYNRVREVGAPGCAINALMRVGQGLRILRDEIRAALGPTWCLVPPLMLGNQGQREGVAVYYDAATLQFTGPWVYAWDAAVGDNRGRPPTAATVGNPAQYTWWWLEGLPNPALTPPLNMNRVWAAPLGAGNVSEWCGAGQWRFWTLGGADIDFPHPGCRPPFYTRMQEIGGAGRILKVFTVHTSPGGSEFQATRNIGSITQLAVGPGEVGVVLGDFNVDSFDPAVNGAYTPLRNLGYHPLLNALNAAGNVVAARDPYCMTHLLTTSLATPFNTVGAGPDPQHNVYPRFGYMGSTRRNPAGGPWLPDDKGSIDNVFVCYPGPAPPPAHNTTIVNTIVGKPYNAGAAPPGVGPDLTGGYGYNPSLANPLPVPAGIPAAAGIPPFNLWQNFGYIHSTSDHLAVLFDV
jgi:hypothetical protein